jgi:hypothetical protein
MGKAKDGTECFTRQNKSGIVYITCEGTQRTYLKSQTTSGKGKAKAAKPKPKKNYNKAALEDRIDIKVRQLDGRPWKSGRGKAKNPHKGMKKNQDGTATTGALKEIVSKFESGILKDNETNRVMYEASKIVLRDRKK